MATTIFDTDILINVGRGNAKALDCLERFQESDEIAISIITKMELVVGCRDKTELREVLTFLQGFQTLQITESTSEKAAELLKDYRLSHGLLIPDAFIAATAIVNDVDLITINQKDFRFISDLKLLPYS